MGDEPGRRPSNSRAEKAGKRPRRGRPPLGEKIQRKRILDAASGIFLTRGFDGTSLDAVAREAGITKRTIYEMVGDKDALFRAVCNYSSASVASMSFPHAKPSMSLEEVLLALARTLLDHALEPSRIALSRMIMFESMRFPDLVSEVLDVGRAHMNRQIMTVFDEMKANHIGVIPDPIFAADIFYDIVVGNQGFRATIGFAESHMTDETLRQRLEVFMTGYLTTKNG